MNESRYAQWAATPDCRLVVTSATDSELDTALGDAWYRDLAPILAALRGNDDAELGRLVRKAVVRELLNRAREDFDADTAPQPVTPTFWPSRSGIWSAFSVIWCRR